MPLKCKEWKSFWRKQWLSKCPYGLVMAISVKSPKNRIFWRVQRGDQGKFFKNRPKSCPRLKGPKALWRKWYYPLISMLLNCKDWRKIRRKQQLQKCPYGLVMAISAKSPKSRIFWKSAKGGPREIFHKSPKKLPSFERPKSTGAPNKDIVQNHLT